jgi:hypothetical protein
MRKHYNPLQNPNIGVKMFIERMIMKEHDSG